MSWLLGLEVGDKVIVERGAGSSIITTVIRITKTRQITVDGVNGRFKDGILMGSGCGYSSYTRITEWTQEKENALKRDRQRARQLHILDDAHFDVLNDEQLTTVTNMIIEYVRTNTSARKGDKVTYNGRERYYDRKVVEGCTIMSAPRLKGMQIMVTLDKGIGEVNVKNLLWE